MEEIKLWKVGGSQDNPTIMDVPKVAQTETEKMLEEILVKAPNLLLDGLKLVGRQVETPGGPLDLLGIDEDGQLIVFELKRGTLTRDAVAQIIDYASYLAELSPLDLVDLVNTGSGKYGIDKITDFDRWYNDQFAGKSIVSIGKPKMVLVGLGVDDRARRMVEFLANGNIEISMLTFHGFNGTDGTYLAKQVEVVQRQIQPIKTSKQTNLQTLVRRMKAAGVENFFDRVAGVLRGELDNPYEWPNQTGYGYYFQDTTEAGTPTNRAYVSLSIPDNPKGSLLLTLQERATQAAGEDWAQIAKSWGARVVKRKGYFEVKIASEEDWKLMEPDLRKLCSAILRGRKIVREQQVVAERQGVNEELSDAGNSAPFPSS
jgi:hypothetical protein